MMKEIQSYNIATNIIGKYYISTAMWPTFIAAAGGQVKTWETFIWEMEKGERTDKVKEYFHHGEKSAIEFHFSFCKKLTSKNLIT